MGTLKMGTAIFATENAGSINVTANSISKTSYNPGEIIETISSTCDGSTIIVKSGTYNITDVTTYMSGTDSYQVVTGSQITYTPPAGTKRVRYEFTYKFDVTENSGISHHIINVDGNQVYPSATNIASNYASTNWHHACFMIPMKFTFQCDASATDVNNGQFSSWTSPKTIDVRYREYSGSYESNLHYNTWWDGTGASGNYVLVKPNILIQAIA